MSVLQLVLPWPVLGQVGRARRPPAEGRLGRQGVGWPREHQRRRPRLPARASTASGSRTAGRRVPPSRSARSTRAIIGIGDASTGLCGGMVTTARDLFEAGIAMPPDTEPPANGSPRFRAIVRRQVESLDWLRTPLRFFDLQAFRPDPDDRHLRLPAPRAVPASWRSATSGRGSATEIAGGHAPILGLIRTSQQLSPGPDPEPPGAGLRVRRGRRRLPDPDLRPEPPRSATTSSCARASAPARARRRAGRRSPSRPASRCSASSGRPTPPRARWPPGAEPRATTSSGRARRIAAMTTIRPALEIAARAAVAERTEALFTRAGALKEGHFLLKSGRHSERYLEKFLLLQDPAVTSELCSFWVAAARGTDGQPLVDVVAGPTTGRHRPRLRDGPPAGRPRHLRGGGPRRRRGDPPRVPARLPDRAGRARPPGRRHPDDRRLAAGDAAARRGGRRARSSAAS